MTPNEVTVADAHIGSRFAYIITFGVLTRFNGNTIIACIECAVEDVRICGCIRIYTITIMNALCNDGKVMTGNNIAVEIVDRPAGRFSNRQVVDAHLHVLAPACLVAEAAMLCVQISNCINQLKNSS